MVASEDDARAATDGNPASGLQRLCCLVDEDGTELMTIQQAVGASNEGTGNDTRLAKELGVDTYLEFVGTVL